METPKKGKYKDTTISISFRSPLKSKHGGIFAWDVDIDKDIDEDAEAIMYAIRKQHGEKKESVVSDIRTLIMNLNFIVEDHEDMKEYGPIRLAIDIAVNGVHAWGCYDIAFAYHYGDYLLLSIIKEMQLLVKLAYKNFLAVKPLSKCCYQYHHPYGEIVDFNYKEMAKNICAGTGLDKQEIEMKLREYFKKYPDAKKII